ncbi:MAG: DUF4365 domain-containing protein [Actinobacteria bacterium]|nr:DUF4365 domain-containing protein [Actinomycetota bacterium]
MEESERAFCGALGATLKFHERLQLEYGIDGDVEHFAHDGSATGLHFFVRLKGTDEPDLSASTMRDRRGLREWRAQI